MSLSPDIDLLHRYATEQSDEAFSEVVARHVDLVYSAALRQVSDPGLAQEISQRVFILLAKKARWLGPGTILSGWLFRATRFVAAEFLRSENRRRVREQKAMEQTEESAGHPPWAEIEPFLDEALARLNDKDRNILLLRFFEKRSLKELADALGIKEDAAQKRVARSLDKLRVFFAERGTVIPAVGLGAALSAFAVQAAPAGLTSVILTALPVSTAGLTLSAITLGAFGLMTTAKKIALLTTAVIALSVPTLIQWRHTHQLRTENAALRNENRQLRADHQELSERLKENGILVAQLQRNTAELPLLRGEVASLRQHPGLSQGSRPQSAEPGTDPSAEASNRTNPMNRMNHGRELRKQGKFAEALQEYLWCFDEGSRDPAFAGVRVSFLLSEIADLGKQFPAAREALISRRDSAEAAVLSGTSSTSAVWELACLNTNLEQQEKNLTLFDQLPVDSPLRGNLVKAAAQQFLAVKRYQDIVEADDPEAAFFRSLSLFMAGSARSKDKPSLNGLPDVQTQMLLSAGSNGVEALAGVGQSDRAKALADKVLTVSTSAETLTRLIQQAERAGNDEVVSYLKAKQPSGQPH